MGVRKAIIRENEGILLRMCYNSPPGDQYKGQEFTIKCPFGVRYGVTRPKPSARLSSPDSGKIAAVMCFNFELSLPYPTLHCEP